MFQAKKTRAQRGIKRDYVVIRISVVDSGSLVLQRRDGTKMWRLPTDIIGPCNDPTVAAQSLLKQFGLPVTKDLRLNLVYTVIRSFDGVNCPVHVFRCTVDHTMINQLHERTIDNRVLRVFRRNEVQKYLSERDYRLAFS